MLPELDRAALIFSIKSYVAAMLALYIAFRMGLPNPFWALITCYMVAQPSAGAVVSKAGYRLIGTVLGAAMAVFLIPPLSQAHVPMVLALATWSGLCVFFATIDQTPRAYLFVMAGVTTCVIAFPSLVQPEVVFSAAIARSQEIGLGILCGTIVHTVVFPKSAANLLIDKIDLALADIARCSRDAIGMAITETLEVDRRKLASSINAIHELLIHAGYENAAYRLRSWKFRVLLAQLEHLLLLTAELDGALRRLLLGNNCQPEAFTHLLGDVRQWLAPDYPMRYSHVHARRLSRRAAELESPEQSEPDAEGEIRDCVVVRLQELIATHQTCRELSHAGSDPGGPFSGPRGRLLRVGRPARRSIERDYFGALVTGALAAVSLAAACAVWIASGWPGGANAVMMAGVFFAVYAGFGDPSQALKNKFIGVIIRMAVGAFYVAAILPAITGFEMLAASLAPVLIVSGELLTLPRYSPLALNLIIGLLSPVIISSQFTGDFAGYINNGLETLTGIMFALVMMLAVQRLWLDGAGSRLMRAIWSDITRATYLNRESWRGRMVHRIALLANRSQRAGADSLGRPLDALHECVTGEFLAELRQSQHAAPHELHAAISDVIQGVSRYYSGLTHGVLGAPGRSLESSIMGAMAIARRPTCGSAGRAALMALHGLQNQLFPTSTSRSASTLVVNAPP